MRSGFRKKWDDLNLHMESAFRGHTVRKSAKRRSKVLKNGKEFIDYSKEYEELVVPYWKKFGIKPNKMWYQMYWNARGEVDPRYVPEDLYAGTIVPYFSNTQFRRFGEDKCFHSVWFSHLKRPETIAMNIAGVYYNPDYEIISREEAVERCLNYDRFLIKPSIDSGEGRLIKFFEEDEVTKENVEKYFSEMQANYIVQKAVEQHPQLSRLNPSSLNTIRVISLFFNDEVHILSSIIRIGAKGSKVDNVGAGGYGCRILPNSRLDVRGVNKAGDWITETESGIKFEDVEIPSFDKVVDAIKVTHKKLPHFKIIGWDFSVDKEGDPVFIEYNTYPGGNQFTCGPTFGDLTDEVLEEVFVKKTLKASQN